jgi:hypothetical protein
MSAWQRLGNAEASRDRMKALLLGYANDDDDYLRRLQTLCALVGAATPLGTAVAALTTDAENGETLLIAALAAGGANAELNALAAGERQRRQECATDVDDIKRASHACTTPCLAGPPSSSAVTQSKRSALAPSAKPLGVHGWNPEIAPEASIGRFSLSVAPGPADHRTDHIASPRAPAPRRRALAR